jgi:thiol:disulfide interchange protein
MFLKFLLAFLLFSLPTFAFSEESPFKLGREGNKYVQIELITNQNDYLISTSNDFKIGALFKIQKGWHIYWKDPGESGQATKVTFTLPQGWRTGELQWPIPIKEVERGNIKTNAYKDEVLLFASLNPPPIVPDMDEEVTIKGDISFLVCNDRCVPGRISIDKTILISSTKEESAPEYGNIFSRYEKLIPKNDEEALTLAKTEIQGEEEVVLSKDSGASFFLVLVFAFVGGLILNVMPCVLPILALKLFSISKSTDKTKKENRIDAMWFSVGVVSTFLILALIAIILKQSGAALGWGFQFQYAGFVLGLIVVLFVLALGFFDVYIANLPVLGRFVNYADSKTGHSILKNIFDGVLITLLSTPCTAPFLGTALVYAFTRSEKEILSVFLFIALGLITPFVSIVSSPSLMKYFPKPGAWMQTIKELLGLGLLGTVVWLLQVASKGGQIDIVNVISLLLLVFILFWGISRISSTKRMLRITFLLICVLGIYYVWPLKGKKNSEHQLTWVPYSDTLIAEAKGPVFLDFTAEWCITCKYNENFILSNEIVLELFKSRNITALKADWTSGDLKITKALEQYGGAGVPHYAYIPEPGAKPIILPSLLSVKVISENL